eukprot:190727-Prymnesium_polylepis.2
MDCGGTQRIASHSPTHGAAWRARRGARANGKSCTPPHISTHWQRAGAVRRAPPVALRPEGASVTIGGRAAAWVRARRGNLGRRSAAPRAGGPHGERTEKIHKEMARSEHAAEAAGTEQ